MAALAACVAFVSCHSLGANVWNLGQVHDQDGRPSRYGNLRSPIEHLLSEFVASTEELGGLRLTAEASNSRIEDPLGVCLDNLIALSNGSRRSPYARALLVQMITWLSGDCTYTLSRERCALEIASVGKWYGLLQPRYPESLERTSDTPEEAAVEGDGPATAEQLVAPIAELIRTSKFAVALHSANPELDAACETVRQLLVDRNGVRRLVAVTALVLRKHGFDAPELAQLRRLHDELCRDALAMALGEALRDPDPLPRAAGVGAWIRLARIAPSAGTPETDTIATEALATGFLDPSPLVVLAAVKAIETYGVPENAPLPTGTDSSVEAASAEMMWMSRLVALMTRLPEGPLHVATCDAMARIAGEERNLHAEYWIERWNAIQRAAVPGPSVEGGRS